MVTKGVITAIVVLYFTLKLYIKVDYWLLNFDQNPLCVYKLQRQIEPCLRRPCFR